MIFYIFAAVGTYITNNIRGDTGTETFIYMVPISIYK